MTTIRFDVSLLLDDAIVRLDNRKRLARTIGVSYACLSHWLAGRAIPNVHQVARILSATGLGFADYVAAGDIVEQDDTPRV